MSWVRIDGVAVAIGGSPVLAGVDLAIERGEVVALLGPSGCGKTTLVRTIAGHLPLSAGQVAVGARLLSARGLTMRPEKRGVGWVPQDPSLFPHLSVRENVAFGLPRGKAGRARADELLALVGLGALGDRPPHALSGGQAQRVALARALAPEPDVVLLDEPFAALDPTLRTALRAEVADLLRQQGTTAVLVTHDQEEALSVADRVAVMREGRMVQTGTPREVYEEPVDAWTAAFVGDVVDLPGTRAGREVQTALGSLIAGEGVPGGDGPVRALLRPEWIRLDDAAGLPVVVESVRYGGHDALVHLRGEGDLRITARVPGPRLPLPGDRLHASVTHPVLVVPVPAD